jgi:hypothetical protein
MSTELIRPEDARIEQAEQQRIAQAGTPEMSIAQTVIPYNHDDTRAKYLGLRASGFTTREAIKYLAIAKSTVSMWRVNDPKFAAIEDDLPKYRKQLANEYVHLEFIRNYRLVLEKDYRVLQESLYPHTIRVKGSTGIDRDLPTAMSDQDFAYLLKARSHYTPQQLEIIERLMSGKENSGNNFNFEEFVLAAAKTTRRVTVESKTATFEAVTEMSGGEH